MATDPYAAFADPVAPVSSVPAADDPYLAVASPVEAPKRRSLPVNELEFELNQRIQSGAGTEDIQTFLMEVDNPTSGKPWAESQNWAGIPNAVAYARSGGRGKIPLVEELVGPDGLPSNKAAAIGRSALDTVTQNWGDELTAMLRSGQITGPEYEQAWAEEQQRRGADPALERGTGQILGILASALPVGRGVGAVGGLGRQALVGSGISAGLTAAAGAGAAGPGTRTDTLGPDALLGAGTGFISPFAAATLRRGAQVAGMAPQSAADDALQATGLDPAELRRLADDFYRQTGKGARLADIIDPATGRALSNPLAVSPAARSRVVAANEASRDALAPDLTRRIIEEPNTVPQALAPAGQSGRVAGQRDVRGPEGIRQQTRREGDVNFAAFRDTPIALRGPDLVYVTETIMPAITTLPRATRAAIEERIARGAVTGGDMDLIRRALAKQAKNPLDGGTYRTMQSEVEDILTGQAPSAQRAIGQYRAGMQAAEGAETGMAAVQPGAGFVGTRDELAGLNPLQQAGVSPGARAALVDRAAGSPGQAYAFARQLEADPGFQARLRATLPAGEADDLIEYATTAKQSVDNIASMARIPPEKIETLLDSTEEMADAIVGLGTGAGGAFKASFTNALLKRFSGIGRGAADKLADDLLSPARRERAIQVLERAGVPKTGLRELTQGAFIAAGASLMTSGRRAEEAPAAERVMTLEVER